MDERLMLLIFISVVGAFVAACMGWLLWDIIKYGSITLIDGRPSRESIAVHSAGTDNGEGRE